MTYLGVLIDEQLNFKSHIDYVCGKVAKSVGVLYRLKNYVPLQTLKSLYYAFIGFPYLNYCNIIWGGTYSSHLQPLIVLQKKVIRIICNKPFNSHTNSLFF